MSKHIFKVGHLFHIGWHGAAEETTGYGSSNWGLLKALSATKVRTFAAGLHNAEKLEVGVAYAPGGMGALESLPTPYRILFTMFEADKWPDEWVNASNCANQVWVPSRFCKESAIASGCEAPVNIVPLGIDPEIFYPPTSEREQKDTFTFGFAGAPSLRKGFELLTRAFTEEFEKERVRLIVQSESLLTSTLPRDIRIEGRRTRLSPDEMRGFYQNLDCFVMPTIGEGFGLTPLEAMACGTPVIVTDWSGCRDYLGNDTLRVAVDSLESCAGYHGSTGRWARPSLASLKYCMRYAFENRKEIAEMGIAAAKRVAKDWTYAKSAQVIETLVKRIDPKERITVEVRDVVIWRGNPRQVRTRAGGFIRGIPRELTPEMAARLEPNDSRFSRETRYRRA